MKLTKEEKQSLIQAKDESHWYALCDDIKARRNGIYPNYLAREILEIYSNKFPIDKYKEGLFNEVLDRKSFKNFIK